MRHYHIYLIEDEVAWHYFGREAKIYQLFVEYERTSHHMKEILKKQIEYITVPIPSLFLHQLLEVQLKRYSEFQMKGSTHLLLLPGGRGQAKLTIYDRYISMSSIGGYEAETIFFEILRKFNSCFLAMDLKLERYGWLNPIKERKFV